MLLENRTDIAAKWIVGTKGTYSSRLIEFKNEQNEKIGQFNVSFYLNHNDKKKLTLNAFQGELFDARLKRLGEVMGKDFRDNSDVIIDNSGDLKTACDQVKARLEGFTWVE